MSFRPKYICNCPFYDREYKRGICCEGVNEDSIGTTTYFISEQKKDAYVLKNCIKIEPKECKIYQMLMEKYKAD